MTPITRRRLLASAEAADAGTGSVPFYGEHQAGIDTAAQDRLHFAAFDLVGGVDVGETLLG